MVEGEFFSFDIAAAPAQVIVAMIYLFIFYKQIIRFQYEHINLEPHKISPASADAQNEITLCELLIQR